MAERVTIVATLQDAFSGPAKRLRASMLGIRQSLTGLRGPLSILSKGFGLLLLPFKLIPGLVRGMISPFRALTSALFNVRTLLTAVVGGLFIRQFARAFGAFEKKLGEIGTLLGETSFEALIPLGRALVDVAVRGAQTLESEMIAAYQAISAGVKKTDLIPFLEQVNILAVAGAATTAQAVEALLTVLKGFALPFSDVAEAADSLFVAVRIGRTTVPELAASLGRVVSIARVFGLTMDETNAAMAALTLTMGNSDLAATALRAILTGLRDATENQRIASKKLGVEITQGALRAKGFKEFILDLAGVVKKNEEAFSKLFPNIRGFTAAAILAANEGKELIRALDGMETKAGEALKGFDLLSQTVGFAFRQLGTLLAGLQIDIGFALGPLFIRISKRIREFIAKQIVPAFRGIGDAIRQAFSEEGEARATARAALASLLFAFTDLAKITAFTFVDVFLETLVIGFIKVGPKAFRIIFSELFERAKKAFAEAIPGGADPTQDLADAINRRLRSGRFADDIAPELVSAFETIFARARTELLNLEGPLDFANLVFAEANRVRLEKNLTALVSVAVEAFGELKKFSLPALQEINLQFEIFLDRLLDIKKLGFAALQSSIQEAILTTDEFFAALDALTPVLTQQIDLGRQFFRSFQLGFADFAGVVATFKGQTAEALTTLIAEFNKLLQKIAEVKGKLRDLGTVTGEEAKALLETFNTLVEELDTVNQQITALTELSAPLRELAEDIGRTLVLAIDDFASGIVNAIAQGKNLGDVFRRVFAQMLIDIATLILRMAILRALSIAFGIPAAGSTGGAVEAKGGGLICRPRGGIIPGPNIRRDIVPALLTPGEYVIRREAVDRYGAAFMRAINQMMIPTAIAQGFRARHAFHTYDNRFQTGGAVTAAAPIAGPTRAFMVPDEETAQALLHGGANAFLDFFRDHRDEILGDARL